MAKTRTPWPVAEFRWLTFAIVVVAGNWLLPGAKETVSANHNLPDCTADNAGLNVQRKLAPGQVGPENGSRVSPGQKLLYVVSVVNRNGNGCNISYADVRLYLPGPNGLPADSYIDLSPLSNCTVIHNGRILGDFPVGDGTACNTTYPPFEYVVDVEPGVTSVFARAQLTATDGIDEPLTSDNSSSSLLAARTAPNTDPDHPFDRHAVQVAKYVSSLVLHPSLVLRKSPDGEGIEPGEAAVFTIELGNQGEGIILGAALDDQLPAGYSWTHDQPGQCSITGGSLHCDVGDMEPGDSFLVAVETQTDPEDPHCRLENVAVAEASNHAQVSDAGEVRCGGTRVASVTTFIGGDTAGGSPWNAIAVGLTLTALIVASGIALRRSARSTRSPWPTR